MLARSACRQHQLPQEPFPRSPAQPLRPPKGQLVLQEVFGIESSPSDSSAPQARQAHPVHLSGSRARKMLEGGSRLLWRGAKKANCSRTLCFPNPCEFPCNETRGEERGRDAWLRWSPRPQHPEPASSGQLPACACGGEEGHLWVLKLFGFLPLCNRNHSAAQERLITVPALLIIAWSHL